MANLYFKIVLKPKDSAKRFARFADLWVEDAAKVHQVALLNTLFWIVNWSRIDTGRLRAGWMAYADSKGYSLQAAMVGSGAGDPSAVAEGKKMGTFQDSPLRTRIINGVNYAAALDDKQGVFRMGPFNSRLARIEKIYGDSVQDWLDQADKMNQELKTSDIKPNPVKYSGGE